MKRTSSYLMARSLWVLAGALLLLPGCARKPSPTRARIQDAGNRSPTSVRLLRGPVAADVLREQAASANVLVCVIDAARADHVGCYGYPRGTTPNMDRLSEESVIFEQHFAPFPLTKPSTASLFTGRYPDTHRIVWRGDVLDPDGFTVANALRPHGFETVFLSQNPLASPASGFGADFDFVCAKQTRVPPGREAGRSPDSEGQRRSWPGAADWQTPDGLVGAFASWLDGRKINRFFAYVHFLPPHIPYEAPDEIDALFRGKKPPGAWQGDCPFPEVASDEGRKPPPLDEWVNAYDANLRWADYAIGEIERVLRERALLDTTLLVITSDHGEAFGEHGYRYHLGGVYDELLRVPLLVRFPGVDRVTGRVGALTQTVDLLPTLLDLLGIPSPDAQVQGRSLLPLLTGGTESVRDYVYARCGADVPSYLVRNQDWALILWEGGRLQALYDLRDDPRETRNVIARQTRQTELMTQAFRRFAAAQANPPLEFVDAESAPAKRPRPGRPKLTDDERRELQALGYLD